MRWSALAPLLVLAAPSLAQPLVAADMPAVQTRAKAGMALAQFDLGRMYRHGIGLPRDSAAAVRWIGSAAEAGHAPAMFTLYTMMAAGEGTGKDEAGARAWLERAAALDDPQALQELALHLQAGTALYERDPERAARLLAMLAHALQHTPHAD